MKWNPSHSTSTSELKAKRQLNTSTEKASLQIGLCSQRVFSEHCECGKGLFLSASILFHSIFFSSSFILSFILKCKKENTPLWVFSTLCVIRWGSGIHNVIISNTKNIVIDSLHLLRLQSIHFRMFVYGHSKNSSGNKEAIKI